MEGQQKRQWGITSAISEAPPTEVDNKLNQELIRTLEAENVFETLEGTRRRAEVLEHFQRVAVEFVRRVGIKKGMNEERASKVGGKVFTFGSYALGVHNPSSDIDTLLVVPRHVSLEDFFVEFPPILRSMSAATDITELVVVREAFVPIITMEFRGVSLDLIFACLPTLQTIPLDMPTISMDQLRGLDDDAMRSVNGTRVVRELIECIPQIKSFRHALRAVKLWSTRRGIYGAVFGYPGGIAWAIMVARICQLYPFACGATILSKFFNLMYKWNWPRPILLKHIDEGVQTLRVWNPQIYPGDAAHILPVITPAFPSMCSTHTVTRSTMSILMKEFARADQIVNEVFTSKKSWSPLFGRHTFFTQDHKYYLSVIAGTHSKEDNIIFSGLVQSKARLLVKGIDDGDTGIDLVRPYPDGIERIHRCPTLEDVERVFMGNCDWIIPKAEWPTDGSVIQPTPGTTERILYTTTFYIGLTLPAESSGSLDISYPYKMFKDRVEESPAFVPKMMSIKVVHTRNTQLPPDLFVEGETRPTKPSKEKKKKDRSGDKDAGKSAKRSFTESGLGAKEGRAKSKRRAET